MFAMSTHDDMVMKGAAVLLAACSMWPLIKLHRHDPPPKTYWKGGGGGLPGSISRLGLVWSLRWESPVIAIYSCPGMGNLESHINLACFTTITAQMPIFLTVRYTMWPSITSPPPPPKKIVNNESDWTIRLPQELFCSSIKSSCKCWLMHVFV